MRRFFGLGMIGLFVLASASSSEACHGRKKCGKCSQQTMVPHPACGPVVMAPATGVPMSYASPQMAMMAPTQAVAPVAAAPTVPTEIQPTYNYSAGATGEPAYYYTYDDSGKMVVTQWRDWLFRGGRAAGEPAPPLPIIGALRGR